ncbi:MAG: hypothetical protein H3C48_13630 [Chitinophagaceae bacterium]|nr:hypothetical protein [Chitinophagaceae bacterium]
MLYSILVNTTLFSNEDLWKYLPAAGRLSTIVEFILFSAVFFRIIQSKTFKKGMLYLTIVVGAYLVYSFITSSSGSIDSVPSGLTALIFFIYCIYYLFEKVKDISSPFLYDFPEFWIVVSIIIYAAGTFFPFINAQTYLHSPGFKDDYELIHSTLYIIRNLLFCVAMLVNPKSSKTYYSSKPG